MKAIKWWTLLLIMIFILTGCKVGKNQATKIQKKDKAPSTLGDISKNLQDILKDTEKIEKILDGTDIEEEKPKEEKKDTTSSDSSQTQGSDGQNSGSQGGNKSEQSTTGTKTPEDKEKKKAEEKEAKLLKTWQQIDKKIEDTHKKWNTFEVEGLKKGVTTDRSNKFEESLNALTKSIEARNIKEIYDYGSQSMLNIAPIFELYKDEIEGEINRIKHVTYQSYLKGLERKDIEALDQLKNYEENINKIRVKLEKNDSKIKILEKLTMSIEDMKRSLKENSIKLTRIKKDIVIKNLDELGK